MRPVPLGRTLRLGVCVTAVAGLLTLGLAAPSFADEPEYDSLWIAAPYEQPLLLGTDGGTPQSRSVDVGITHSNDYYTVTDGEVTVDISGLAGVAEVTWPANCVPSGTTAVCAVPEVPVSGGAEQIHLTVRAADGAAAGAQGTITYEATATGGPDGTLTAYPEETTLTVVSGPDLVLDAVPWKTEGAPGDRVAFPVRLTNNGNESAHGITVKLLASYGLTELTQYDACTYTSSPGGQYAPSTRATCSFDQVLAPGDSFELPAPLGVTLAQHALNERLDITVEPGDGAADLVSRDNFAAAQIGADNTADFSVIGDEVSGAAGQTVTTRLTFKNNGPAWFGNLGSGAPAAYVRLIVPSGTTVTAAPTECRPRTLSGGYYPQPTGAPRYDCALPYWVSEDAERSFDLSLRIDTAAPGTTGAVSVNSEYDEFPFDFDPDFTNNTAELTVN